MTTVSVNHKGIEYLVNINGTKKRAFIFIDPDNPVGSTKRAFNISTRMINDEDLTYRVGFVEIDIINSENWESKAKHSFPEVLGKIDLSWITSDKLDLQAWKMDAINQLFLQKLNIKPLNSDGTVKLEYK